MYAGVGNCVQLKQWHAWLTCRRAEPLAHLVAIGRCVPQLSLACSLQNQTRLSFTRRSSTTCRDSRFLSCGLPLVSTFNRQVNASKPSCHRCASGARSQFATDTVKKNQLQLTAPPHCHTVYQHTCRCSSCSRCPISDSEALAHARMSPQASANVTTRVAYAGSKCREPE